MLDASIELRERNDRHLQLLGERLQVSRDLGDFCRPILGIAVYLHQLQVVDDDQTQVGLAFQSPRPRPNFRWRQAGRVVDIDGRVGHELYSGVDSRPVLIGKLAGPEVRLIDAAERGDHAERELLGGHFHRINCRRHAGADGCVLGNVDGERRLAHRRSTGNDNQVAGLQAGGQFVELVEAARDTRDIAAFLVQQVDAVHRRRKNLLERPEAGPASRAGLGDLEHEAFGFVDQLRRGPAVGGKCAAADLVTCVDQRAQGRALAENLRIGAGIGGARRLVGQRGQVFEAAGVLELVTVAEVLRDRDDVAGMSILGKRGDRPENQAVILAIEVVGDDDVGDLVPGLVVQHETAEQ